MSYLKFKRVVPESYRSFKQKTVFNLDRKPGLYFIYGDNQVEPELGSNSCGKSTIFDAIKWCFSGSTLEDVKGGNIKSWDQEKKTCSVETNIDIDDVPTTIVRTHTPISLKINNENKTDAELSDLTHLDGESIKNGIIIGQFHESFLLKEPGERLKTFSKIMGLEYWEKCSDLAKAKANKSETEYASLVASKEVITNQLNSYKQQQVEMQSKLNGFEAEREIRLQSIRTEISTQVLELSNLKAKKLSLDSSIQQLEEKLKEHTNIHVGWNFTLSEYAKEEIEFNNQLIEIDTNYRLEKQNYNKWRGLKGTCPTCTQVIDPSITSAEKVKINRLLLDLSHSREEVAAKAKELLQRKDPLKIDIANLTLTISDCNVKIKSLTSEFNEVVKNHGILEQSLSTNNAKLSFSSKEENPYTDLLRQLKDNTTITEQILTTKQLKIEQAYQEQEGYGFWIKGFKELRLWLISDALNALEIETNNALSQLGLLEWAIKYTIEKETGSGTLSKGLHILIYSKQNKSGTVPIELYSGGQRGRLKLAVALGMISFIQNYKGFESSIEVFDEPVSFINENGINSFIEFLAERAQNLNKVIFYIDQKRLENVNFTSIINVVLTNVGSIINE